MKKKMTRMKTKRKKMAVIIKLTHEDNPRL